MHVKSPPAPRGAVIIFSMGAYLASGHGYDYVSGLGGALAALGHEVRVIGWEGPKHLPEPLQERQVSHPKLSMTRERRRQLGPLGDALWGIQRVRNQRVLLKALSEAHRDWPEASILFETFEYVSLSRFVTRQKLRYACIFHDTNFNTQHRSRIAGAYKRAVRKNVRTIVHAASHVYVHGEEMKKNLIQNASLRQGDLLDKVHAIPHGAPHPDTVQMPTASEARSQLALPEMGKVLLAFGTLRRDKCFEPAIQAVAQCPEWLLVVAGPEGDVTYDQITKLANRHCVADRVKLMPGYISPEMHPVYFAAADVVVNTYDQTMRHESGTAQKARTFLKPVIVSGGPDLVDYVNAHGVGWAVDPSQPATLVKALQAFANLDNEQRKALEQRIYQCASTRSWEAVAKILSPHLAGLP